MMNHDNEWKWEHSMTAAGDLWQCNGCEIWVNKDGTFVAAVGLEVIKDIPTFKEVVLHCKYAYAMSSRKD